MKSKSLIIFLSIVMFIVGGVVGIGGVAYITLPYNEELVETSDVYYSLSEEDKTVAIADGVQPAQEGAVSIHFLELGNKYTGDCTYIKVGENIDILIDCGSKSNSISTVTSYLNEYVTDGILEYVIVTHAHEDHYAGFATSTNIQSIFDLFECKNIITFSTTNQKASSEYDDNNIVSYASASKSESKMYNNFNRELEELLARDSEAKHLTVQQIIEDEQTYPNGEIVLDDKNDITLQILDSYYYTAKASTENDYSVCAMLNQGDKHFIFTGDLEEKGEEYLIETSRNPVFAEEGFYVELYKAGHHGSKTSSTMEMLEVLKPKIVCVCCCAGSSEYTSTPENQFPTKEFIINVSQFTTQVYVTTLCIDYKQGEFTSFNGNIVVMAIKDSDTSVYCSNNTTLLKDTEWFKNNRLQMCTEGSGLTLHSSWLE